MRPDEAYEVWAPSGGPWSPWVKPILFAAEPNWDPTLFAAISELNEPAWLASPSSSDGYRELRRERSSEDLSTAYVIDLPGAEAIAWGLFFARRGWRPIPLYNAIPGGYTAPVAPAPLDASPANPFATPGFVSVLPHALVDVSNIVRAMVSATGTLHTLGVPANRPPVFLLDADRRVGVGTPVPGRFDNRSISLPTDFPSAVFLRAQGIQRVVLLQATAREPQEDLAHTLLAWQQGGLVIESKSLANDEAPSAIEVTPPSRFRAAWYRFLATIGLRRSPLGGFGGAIPIPSAG
ncbi:MAG: hypothetical protein J0L92_11340 [Deltaproteobacteria bacterium]|nr:hypothetical protein [Deltaproteobacteria bacterium]